MKKKWSLFGQINFYKFFQQFFGYSPQNHTQPTISTTNLSVTRGSLKNRTFNQTAFAELVANSFYFTLNPRKLNYSKSKKSYNFFLGTSCEGTKLEFVDYLL